MQTIISEKIKLVRLMRRLSMEQLISLMGNDAVSKMAISKIERGIMNPSEKTLKAIAKACNVPVEYFYKENIGIGDMVFRSAKGITTKEMDQMKAKVIHTIHKYFEQESYVLSPTPFKNPMKGTILSSYTDAENAAITLRRKWEIGIQPIFSAYELIQDYGIHVLELDFENEHIDGISTFINGKIPVMVINTRRNITTERKRFTAFHELAHLLFKLRPLSDEEHARYLENLPKLPYTSVLKCPDEERLCNIFAGAMLLPSQCIARRIGSTRTEISTEELISIRECYGISIAATIHRLHDLRIIDDNLYNKFFEEQIKANPMEEGWGEFPIKEKADRGVMMKIRLENEIKD